MRTGRAFSRGKSYDLAFVYIVGLCYRRSSILRCRQKWSYEDFCDVTIRLEDCTYALNRQVEVIALVRSFRPIPVDEFDRIARPLIMSRNS